MVVKHLVRQTDVVTTQILRVAIHLDKNRLAKHAPMTRSANLVYVRRSHAQKVQPVRAVRQILIVFPTIAIFQEENVFNKSKQTRQNKRQLY